jgi:hypothetical protein
MGHGIEAGFNMYFLDFTRIHAYAVPGGPTQTLTTPDVA